MQRSLPKSSSPGNCSVLREPGGLRFSLLCSKGFRFAIRCCCQDDSSQINLSEHKIKLEECGTNTVGLVRVSCKFVKSEKD